MDEAPTPEKRELSPLDYHRRIVAYFRENEPQVWAWAQSADVQRQQAAETRAAMLRETYRLEPGSHPEVFAAADAARSALGIDAPVTLYQANDGSMNASLCFIPGEVHLIFFGPILEKLDPAELLALMGHELAHFHLWSIEDGAFHQASRILDLALSYADAAPSHRETARLMSLVTELYADRAAALAAGEIAPAVSLLVKTMTGLSTVDPAAYLRQAEELEEGAGRSGGQSHPESFLRARALDRWWSGDPGLEEWLDRRLAGPLSIEALDLLRQAELTAATRGFLARFLKDVPDPEGAVLNQVRRLFPDFGAGEAPFDYAAIARDRIDDATRGYFIALMFDCAMADGDSRDSVMLAAAKAAAEIGATDLFKQSLKRDLKWTRAAADRLVSQAARAA
ncbi:MAG: M48 family metalloprotease [Alphaproteobacteria bacterium]|nr:M48 family metalloprotease [Alphaproteobacteria bacterium]MBV9370506.1 M48 family metalloprotease [Alphaproteobacteria bacterium]MBV9901407.1 M48 family metalloprotease [Alphaproteobacteria bacterium]